MDEKEVSEMQEEMMTVLVVEPMKAPYVKSIPNVVGLTEDDFTSLTPEQIEKFKEKYQSPEAFTLFNGELHVMKMPPQEQKEQKESRKKDAQQKNPAKGKKKNRSGEAR